MGHAPKMAADFRVLLVTVIALNTAMRLKSKLSDGNALYPEFGYVFPEAELFDSAGDCDKVHHIFLVDTPIGLYFEEYLKEAGREEDEGPRACVEATQAGNILMKKGLEIMKATL